MPSRINNDIDLDLIRRALTGEQSAYTELYNSYRPLLTKLFARRGVRPIDIEDLIQTSFIHAFRALHKFRSESRFSTWLYRIAFNELMMRCRDMRRLNRNEKITVSIDQPVDIHDDGDSIQKEISCTDRMLASVGGSAGCCPLPAIIGSGLSPVHRV